jgi:hypothetical protein
MNALLTLLLMIFGAGYLIHMAWTGEVRTRGGVWWKREEDPTIFWGFWGVDIVAYAWLLYSGTGVILDAAR